MATSIIMPKAGMVMEQGTILRWLKREGEPVRKGEPLLSIETDKVSMELEAEADGVLLRILRREGEAVPVTETIGWIGEPGEPAPGDEALSAAAPPRPRVPATPSARRLAAAGGLALEAVAGSGPGGAVQARDVREAAGGMPKVPARGEADVPPEPGRAEAAAARPAATPLARKVAGMQNIDLRRISGSGPGGRIRRRDVESSPPREAGPAAPGPAAVRRQPFSGMRRRIAEKMLQSHQTVPSATLCTRADVTELARLRASVNERGAVRLTLTDFILRATVLALKECPRINTRIEGQEIVFLPAVHLGVAVTVGGEDGGEEGLVVPVIRSAEDLSLRQLAARRAELVEKARGGRLAPDECTGGTFTVSNLGTHGILTFTPIINVPESAILGVGAVEEAPRFTADGRLENRQGMGLCLTHDHRHIDGAQGAVFLRRIRERLEHPVELLLAEPGY
jgi:pyruvate dehydrogenase E2 component (dihydrolipoamide acetyltransferase)